ncbi:hypothetical protein AB1I63_06190 [Streptococcus pneumoniae]
MIHIPQVDELSRFMMVKVRNQASEEPFAIFFKSNVNGAMLDKTESND